MNKKFYIGLLILGALFFILAFLLKSLGKSYFFKLCLALGIMLTLKGIAGYLISHSKKILEE